MTMVSSKASSKISAIIGALLLILGLGVNTQAQVHTSIHSTEVEIAEWNIRRTATSGRFKTDWDRILARANSFVSTPRGTWPGNQVNAAWHGDNVRDCEMLPNFYPGGSSTNCAANNRTYGDHFRDAGFVWMLTGDSKYLTPMKTLMLEQVAMAGSNFANTTRWPLGYLNMDKDFHISSWLRKMAYGYSYIRGEFTSGERASIDTWFINAATWLNDMVHTSAVVRFPDRLSDGWTLGSRCNSTLSQNLTHFGGHTVVQFGYSWDNKQSLHNAASTAVAVITNNATLKTRSKRFLKEFVVANMFPDGTIWDQRRWEGATPQSGWNYATTTLGSNLGAAVALARAGDTEILDFSTTQGVPCPTGGGTAGGPKSILKAMQRYSDLALGNVFIYASRTATTDPAYRIDPITNSPFGSTHYVHDVMWPMANLYYKDSLVQQAYNRSMPTSTSYGGYDPWGGDWGNISAGLFMYAGMEPLSDAFEPVTPPDTTPTAEARVTSVQSTAVTDHVLGLSPLIQQGNMLLCVMGTNSTPTFTWPSGWTELFNRISANNDIKWEARWKIAGASEPTQITVTTSTAQRSAAHCFLASSNHESAAPEVAFFETTSGNNTTEPNPPSLSPSWGSGNNQWIALMGSNAATVVPSITAYPTNYTNGAETDTTGGGSGFKLGSAWRHASAESEDPGPFTIAAASPILAATIAIRPQSAVAAHVWTQTRFRFAHFYNTSEPGPEWIAAENANISVAPQSRFRLRIKLRCTVEDPPSTNIHLRYSKNGGDWTALTDAFVNGIKAAGAHPDAVADATATTHQLTSDGGSYHAGRVNLTAAPVTFNCPHDSQSEQEFAGQFDDTVVPNTDVFRFRIFNGDSPLNGGYNFTPEVSIVPYRSGAGF